MKLKGPRAAESKDTFMYPIYPNSKKAHSNNWGDRKLTERLLEVRECRGFWSDVVEMSFQGSTHQEIICQVSDVDADNCKWVSVKGDPQNWFVYHI